MRRWHTGSIDYNGWNYREPPLDIRRRLSLVQCFLTHSATLLWFFSKTLLHSLWMRELVPPKQAPPFPSPGKIQVKWFWLSPWLIGKVEKEGIPWVKCLLHWPGHLSPDKGHPRFSHLHPWNLRNLIISAIDQFGRFLFSFEVVHSLFLSD